MTYRIDTLRNMLAGSRELLKMLGEELDDLHTLAYERPTAQADQAKVKGGSSDYALDNHGSLAARNAYRHLGQAVVDMCNRADYAVSEASKILRVGDTPARTPRTVQLAELAEQIARQAKRTKNGEHAEAVRRGPQPDEQRALLALHEKLQAKERDLAAAMKEIHRLRNQIAAQSDRRRHAS